MVGRTNDMKVIASELGGVLAFEPTVHGDSRGFFFESHREDEFRRAAADVWAAWAVGRRTAGA